MKNILITWARSYVAWSLVKLAKTQDNINIFLWDSNKKSISFASKYCNEKIIFPSPRYKFQEFKNYILNIIKEKNIDIIYPTCEEVFYFAQIKNDLEEQWVKLFCDDFEKLKLLHSKYKFIKYIKQKNFTIKTPKTEIINKQKDLKNYIKSDKII